MRAEKEGRLSVRERVRGKRCGVFFLPPKKKEKKKRGVLTGLAAHSDSELHAWKGGSIIHRQGCREREKDRRGTQLMSTLESIKGKTIINAQKDKKGQNDSQDFDPTERGKRDKMTLPLAQG